MPRTTPASPATDSRLDAQAGDQTTTRTGGHAEIASSSSQGGARSGVPRARSQLFAVEQRMLFDGAMAADAATLLDPAETTGEGADPLTASATSAPETTGDIAEPARGALVVIDPTVRDWQVLSAGLTPGARLLVLEPDGDALAQIARAMTEDGGQRDSVHWLTHGQSDGRLVIGGEVLDAARLAAHAESLAIIGQHLSPGADLLLYGCDIADGEAGVRFLQRLAEATGADVAASSDDTGAGGDWVLEQQTGAIESALPIDAATLARYQGVLAATPAVSLDLEGPDNLTLIGEGFTLNACFSNPGTIAGFGPYVDLFVPARGVDGGALPDGVTITGASYLGAALTPITITLSATDIANGTVAHPYFRDAGGSDRVSIPGGYQAGDHLVVIQLPFGSFTPGQPAAEITISGTLSELADVGSALAITARGGFQYGNDALDNASADPSIEGAQATLALEPALYRLTTTYIGPESETATGPNFARGYRIDVNLAAGQTLDAVDLGLVLADGMQYRPISGTPAAIGEHSLSAAPAGGWVNVNGVLLSGAGTSTATPSTTLPGGTVTRGLASVTGTTADIDASMVVQFHVPEFDAGGSPVLDAVSGDAATLAVGTEMAGTWNPIDARDPATQAVSQFVAIAHWLQARSLATQKHGEIVTNAGASNLTPGDVIRYTLASQVSDFFAMGGDAAGTDLVLTDTLSDGQQFLDSTTTPPAADPTLVVTRGGATESHALTPGVHYTTAINGAGQTVIRFNLRSALPAAGHGQLLIGDLFADASQEGGTTATIQYSAIVLDAYRSQAVNSAGQPVAGATLLEINEGDFIANEVTLGATVMDADLDPTEAGLSDENDVSSVVFGVHGYTVGITLTGINGLPPGAPARVSPGDGVTYRLSYTIPTGDFENLTLSAYLPLPILSSTDPDQDGLANPFVLAGGPFTDAPAVGEYSVRAIGGDGGGVSVTAVTADAGGNSLTFALTDRVDASNTTMTVEIFFTVRAADAPFADGLYLTTQAHSGSESTAHSPIASNAITQMIVAEPSISMFKGVVGDDVLEATSTFDPAYSPSSPTGLMRPAGDGAANPLLGTVTDASALGLDNDLSNVDAGDSVRMAIVLTNDGSSPRGAFDVRIRDVLAANLDPASLANLRVVRGDGTPVTYHRVGGGAATIADLFGVGIELDDTPPAGPDPALGAIAGTLDASGSPSAPGANLVIITYDARVLASAASNAAATSDATLFHYAGSEGGPDFTIADPSDAAIVRVAPPSIDKQVIATDRAYTSLIAGHENVVVGEVVTYQVTLTVAEGVTANAQFIDTLDANLSIVELVSATASAGVSTTTALGDFPTVTPTDANGGTANRLSFDFGTITNANTDNATTETITLVYRAVVSDVAANQTGAQPGNAAALSADHAAVSIEAPHLTVVEPNVSAALLSDVVSADAGDTVTFTLTLTSNGGAPAFDVALSDVIPAGLTYVPASLSQTAGPAATALGVAGATITGAWSQIDPGNPVVIQFQATLDAGVTVGQALSQTAQVDWSSAPGAVSDLSPYTAAGDRERDGAGGVDDYRASSTSVVTVTTPVAPLLSIVQTSENQTPGASLAVGEIVRYRMVLQLPEATATDLRVSPALPPGLRFLNDGSSTVAFVADGGLGGIDSSTLAGADLDQTAGGLLPGDVSAVPALFVMPGSAIVDGAGTPIAAGPMASGAEPVFRLGDLVNLDRDANREFVVIEFNAVVDNAAGVASGLGAPVSFGYQADTVTVATSNTVAATVVEPAIASIDKRVIGVSGDQVTYEVRFTNTGSAPALDLRLTDAFAGAINQSFDGAAGVTLSSAPVGTSNDSTATDLDVLVPVLAVGESVVIRYTATIPDITLVTPARSATVVYSGLADGVGGGETMSVAVSGGSALSTSTGERTGDSGDYGGAMNNYRRSDAAGLGVISGRLWDDTAQYDGTYDGGALDAPLAARSVTLSWAGADGAFGNGDDQSFAATTAADGGYVAGALPAGNYRISTSTGFVDGVLGTLNVFDDGGASGPATDGLITLTLADAGSAAGQDFLYVQRNDAPVITVGPARSIDEDAPTAFIGADRISVADPDAGASVANRVTLSVSHGTLDLGAAGGVTLTGNGTASVTLEGGIADLNLTLASLIYQSDANYNGPDTLTVAIDDRGHTGDADGDGVPGETAQDALTDLRTIALTITGINDAPLAHDDARAIDEEGVATGQAISPDGAQQAAGDAADTDVDMIYGDTLTVQGVAAGSGGGTLSGNVGVAVAGAYGELTLAAGGGYHYQPGAAAQALPAGATVHDRFSYTIVDAGGATANATITITITGVNDAVYAEADARLIGEDDPPLDGNAIAGAGPMGGGPGDVGDYDPDGDGMTVQGVQAGATGAVLAGGAGAPVTGGYGTLVLHADGSYTYTLDPRAQPLAAGQSVTDVFSYTVTDSHGSTDTTTLTITIEGTNDAPVAADDARATDEDTPISGQALDPSPAQQLAGDQPDDDVDRANGDTLSVQGAGAGPSATPLSGGLGGAGIAGSFGTLVMQPDGQYSYTPGAGAAALALGETATEVFTYTIRDGPGATANATLTITLTGVNDGPLAQPDANTIFTQALAPVTGNVIGGGASTDAADTDEDLSDTLTVVGAAAGSPAGPLAGGVGTPLSGQHGTLTLQSDGAYAYALEGASPAVLALLPGQTLTDIFGYTIDDGHGGQSSTTLTVTIRGLDDMPSGADAEVALDEDTSTNLLPEDFGFSDPDAGDALQAVRFDTLPTSGVLTLDGQPLIPGQIVPAERLDQVMYTPAPNANAENLPAPPSFTFSVRDRSGLFDPAPNVLVFRVTPVNDAPLAPSLTTTIDAQATLTNLLSAVTGLGAPSDVDLPAQTLSVTIDASPDPLSGSFHLPDDRVVSAGMTLTPEQLRSLRFVPNPANPAPASAATGLIPAGSLHFTVHDGHGGAAPGEIVINVRPIVPPPRLVATRQAAESFAAPMLAAGGALPPTAVALTGSDQVGAYATLTPTADALRAGEPVRAATWEARTRGDLAERHVQPHMNTDFDPRSPWTSDPERLAALAPPKAERTAPTTAADDAEDCEDTRPKPKAKAKPRAVRTGLSEADRNRLIGRSTSFSEQLSAARKPYRTPVRPAPRSANPDC